MIVGNYNLNTMSISIISDNNCKTLNKSISENLFRYQRFLHVNVGNNSQLLSQLSTFSSANCYIQLKFYSSQSKNRTNLQNKAQQDAKIKRNGF